jgi:EmrB/QacA subfamily drug resistance transporter
MTEGSPPPALPAARVRLIFGALMLVLVLAMLDSTIVSTALPTIVGELGGIEHLSWVVTAYLLASTVVGPLYGKLGDLYGRKRILQGAIVIFVAGSALCGVAQDMTQLIVFRAVQGIGGGGLFVTAIAVIGDIVAPRERGRYQGYTSSALAVATVAGPLLGGFFVDHLSWRWIFYVNLPIGLAAFVVIGAVFRARPAVGRQRIDYRGAVVLTTGLSALVLAASLGGQTVPWLSWQIIALAVLGVSSTVAFVLVERGAPEPLVPLELFRIPTIRVVSALGFVAGFGLFGATTFLPSYLQVVRDASPTGSGLQMVSLMGGLLATSVVSGLIISRRGRYRVFPILGTAAMTTGLALCATLGVATPTWHTMLFMLVLGAGIGTVMPVISMAAQNAVERRHLGVATSTGALFRQMGGSIGVALFGAVFVNRLTAELRSRLPADLVAPTSTDPAAIQALPPEVHDPYVAAFAAALQPVFIVAAGLAFVAFLIALRLPEVPLRETSPAAEARSRELRDASAPAS